MKKGAILFCFLVALSFVSAASVGDNIPIQIQTIDDSGNIITGTFTFTINISNSASCSPVLYSNTTTKTTDSRGIVSYNLENINLSFDEQYWFCYYRDGILKDTVKAARVPYAFRAKNVTLSGVDIDTNLVMGIYNITAGIGNFGAGLSVSGYRLNVAGNVNVTGNISIGGNYLCNTTNCFSFADFNVTGANYWTLSGNNLSTASSSYNVGIGITNPSGKLSIMPNAGNFNQQFTVSGWNLNSVIDDLALGINMYVNSSGGQVPINTSRSAWVLLGRTANTDTNGLFWLNYINLSGIAYNFITAASNPIASGAALGLMPNGGNVGIGTISPSNTLDVRGTGNFSGTIYINNATNIVNYLSSNSVFASVNTSLLNVSNFFFVNGSNVGIGTTSPLNTLHVNSGTNEHQLTLSGPANAVGETAGLEFKYNAGVDGNIARILGYTQSGGGGDILFQTAPGGASAYATQMILLRAGNIGIGTTSPSSKLDLEGSGSLGIEINSTNSQYPFINFYSGTKLWQLSHRDSDNFFGFFEDGANSRLSIQEGGNVGIGTTSPDLRFHIYNATGAGAIIETGANANASLELAETGASPHFHGARLNLDGLNNLFTIQTELNGAFTDILTIPYSGGSAGNVGIGTTSPGDKLEVSPSMTVRGSGSYSAIHNIGNATGDVDWQLMSGYPSAGLFSLRQTGVVTAITIQNTTGNVGIGTTSPGAKLQIGTGSTIVDFAVGALDTDTTAGNTGFHITTYTNDYVYVDTKLGTAGKLYFRYGKGAVASSTNVWMAMDAGSVGIGTTSPLNTLQVMGGASGYGITIGNVTENIARSLNIINSAGTAKIGVAYSANQYLTGTAAGDLAIGPKNANSILFGNVGETATTVYMKINGTSGSVGIGTTSPGDKLDVNGHIRVSAGNGYGFRWDASTGMYSDGAGGMFWQTGATTKMTLLGGGNVGIGTTNPGAKLEVNGTLLTYGVYAAGSSTGVYGTGFTYGIYGNGSTAVYGSGTTYGVFGTSPVYGVYGYTEGSGGQGVRGYGPAGGYNFYAAGPGTDYGTFTGAHEVKLSDDFPKNIKPGMIVSVTGENQKRMYNGTVTLSSTLPTVKLSETINDKKVFGVLLSITPLPKEHWYNSSIKADDRFGVVNALGDGRVLVTNINGDIEAGDYITSSNISGYGQKQDDDLVHSYTLGKCTENVDWENVTETVNYKGKEYKAYLIGVVYTSG